MPSSFIGPSYGAVDAGRELRLFAQLLGPPVGGGVAPPAPLVALRRGRLARVADRRAAGLQRHGLGRAPVARQCADPRVVLEVEDVAGYSEAVAADGRVNEVVALRGEVSTAVGCATAGSERVAVDNGVGHDDLAAVLEDPSGGAGPRAVAVGDVCRDRHAVQARRRKQIEAAGFGGGVVVRHRRVGHGELSKGNQAAASGPSRIRVRGDVAADRRSRHLRLDRLPDASTLQARAVAADGAVRESQLAGRRVDAAAVQRRDVPRAPAMVEPEEATADLDPAAEAGAVAVDDRDTLELRVVLGRHCGVLEDRPVDVIGVDRRELLRLAGDGDRIGDVEVARGGVIGPGGRALQYVALAGELDLVPPGTGIRGDQGLAQRAVLRRALARHVVFGLPGHVDLRLRDAGADERQGESDRHDCPPSRHRGRVSHVASLGSMPNRLAAETSPYLLQHKDNPVDWHPWGDEALERSRAEDKPVLLSIGYSSCHWCHVMERESFEDAETAAYMNENFVPVKVDREERPDVDAIYMEFVQRSTGSGGWPLPPFLDTDAVPFFGGTYFPPDERPGLPSFKTVMEAVATSWHTQREQIGEMAERVRDELGAIGRIEPSQEPVGPEAVERAVRTFRMSADMRLGGFGGPPKFPPSSALELLLARGVNDVVEVTLDAMAHGGIYDQLGGGFARYSVDERWLVPHFEKMLYDNSLLARVYLHGWQALGHDRYRRVACETLDWALREMRGPEGGFYSALDADSEGEEGRFYVWTPDQIRGVLSPAEPDDPNRISFSTQQIEKLMQFYGVSEGGNFEGRSILHLARGCDAEEPEALGEMRRALYEARAKRVWPGLDDKRLASWNALMVPALAEAGAVLERDDYLDAAKACAEFIWEEMRDSDGNLLRTYKDGRTHLNAYLEDHAYLLEALLTLYEATFEQRWFERAQELAKTTVARFGDPDRGGFFSTSDDHESLIAR